MTIEQLTHCEDCGEPIEDSVSYTQCQECWERYCSERWWQMIAAIGQAQESVEL